MVIRSTDAAQSTDQVVGQYAVPLDEYLRRCDAIVGEFARLKELALPQGRLKTGTPPRLDGKSIDFSVMERGDPSLHKISIFSPIVRFILTSGLSFHRKSNTRSGAR